MDRRNQIRVWVGSGWARYKLNPNVGRTLSRHGTLANQFRSKPSSSTPSTVATTISPSYAEVARRRPMEGNGYGVGGGVSGADQRGYQQGPGQFQPGANGGALGRGQQGYVGPSGGFN